MLLVIILLQIQITLITTIVMVMLSIPSIAIILQQTFQVGT